jgi:hypothetical protein
LRLDTPGKKGQILAVLRIHDIFGVDPDPDPDPDPCLLLMDPDPAILVIDLQEANKKIILRKNFSAYYFLKVHLHHLSKVKSQKEVTKQ